MTGIQEYDYLSDEAKNALAIFNGIAGYVSTADQTLSSVENGFNKSASGLSSVTETIAKTSGNMDEAMKLLDSGDVKGAMSLIDTAKNTLSLAENDLNTTGTVLSTSLKAILEVQAGCAAIQEATKKGITLVNNLIPMIYDAKRKIAGDLKTWNFYQCNVCSFGCTSKYKFKPVEGSIFLVTCALDQSPQADFKFTHTETEGP